MFPQINAIASSMSGFEQASLGAVLIGVAGLVVARLMGGSATMPRRAYGKIYSGAPAANTESKPDVG
jgi:hypothetical protein